MKVIAITVAVIALASSALAQSTSHTFHLTTVTNAPAMRGIATIVRALDVKNVDLDEENQNITVSGDGDELALAKWLIEQFDSQSHASSIARYTIAGVAQDSVRIFYLAHKSTQAADLNEFLSTLRAVGDIQRIAAYTPPYAIVLRTSADKAHLAEWMVSQLDVPPGGQNGVQRYPIALDECADGLVEVAYLAHPVSQVELNEILRKLRSEADIRHLFTHTAAPQAVAFRGCPAQMEMAESLLR